MGAVLLPGDGGHPHGGTVELQSGGVVQDLEELRYEVVVLLHGGEIPQTCHADLLGTDLGHLPDLGHDGPLADIAEEHDGLRLNTVIIDIQILVQKRDDIRTVVVDQPPVLYYAAGTAGCDAVHRVEVTSEILDPVDVH